MVLTRPLHTGRPDVDDLRVRTQPDDDPLPAIISAPGSFEQAARAALRHLRVHVPMGLWGVTRVEHDRQTYLVLDDQVYGLEPGASHPWQSSFCLHMAAGGSPPVALDAQAVPLYAQAALNHTLTIGAYAGAPVREPDGTLFGALCGLDPYPRDADSALASAGPLLELLGEMLTYVLAAERARERAVDSAVAAERSAERDALTGLHNRRGWDRVISEEDASFRRLGDPTVVVLLDLDHMKTVNDQAGHAAGDAYLRRAADALVAAVRSTDLVARLGGDEFGILLRSCDADAAPERVGAVTAALIAAQVQASAGWASVTSGRGFPKALAAADDAMYSVKRERRIARLAVTRPDLFPSPRVEAGMDEPVT